MPKGPRQNDGTYCSTLTDRQVQNVYVDERQRMRDNPKGSPVWEAARELRDEAIRELARRGIEPD